MEVLKKLVSKSLLLKKKYQDIESIDSLPELLAEDIGQLLVDIDRIWPFIDCEFKAFPVDFRNSLEGTRKDIVFSYKDKVPILGEPVTRNGKTIPTLAGMKDTEKIIKVDIVSFFTQIKEKSCEFRIYQLGRRYAGEDNNFKS